MNLSCIIEIVEIKLELAAIKKYKKIAVSQNK